MNMVKSLAALCVILGSMACAKERAIAEDAPESCQLKVLSASVLAPGGGFSKAQVFQCSYSTCYFRPVNGSEGFSGSCPCYIHYPGAETNPDGSCAP